MARELVLRSSSAAVDGTVAGGAAVDSGGVARIAGRLRAFVERLTDNQLALGIGVALFVLAAWPLALVEVPPYQDLPNHLAAITVITHPERYPELVFNGFFKTNAALFAWLFVIGKVVGVKVAARLFVLLVLALNAVVFPLFVLKMTGSRQKLLVASLFLVPMVHNWFVSMGMLDFALGVPLALLLVLALHRQSIAPSWKNAWLITAAGACTWYAHVFGLLVVHLLLLVHLATRKDWSERVAQAKALLLPLAPITALVCVSLYRHFTEPVGAMTGYISLGKFLPPWELAYNLWAEWMWGFTKLSISSFVPACVLAVLFWTRRREEVPLLSRWAFGALALFFVFTPYIVTNWFHVNSRFIPFLWAAALLRVPTRVPRWLVGVLGVSTLLYTIGMGVDFVRLDRDRAQFTAGIGAVPEGAKLLPLLFSRQLTSENTRSLQHAWGFYVLEKQTSAPLLFAHSRSFPVMYSPPPPARFNHLVLETFAPSMGTADWMCSSLRAGGVVVDDCNAEWRARWSEFWADAQPRYDHLLVWDATPEALALVPPAYRVAFHEDRLTIYERSMGDEPEPISARVQ
jgi:hypothetical protein